MRTGPRALEHAASHGAYAGLAAVGAGLGRDQGRAGGNRPVDDERPGRDVGTLVDGADAHRPNRAAGRGKGRDRQRDARIEVLPGGAEEAEVHRQVRVRVEVAVVDGLAADGERHRQAARDRSDVGAVVIVVEVVVRVGRRLVAGGGARRAAGLEPPVQRVHVGERRPHHLHDVGTGHEVTEEIEAAAGRDLRAQHAHRGAVEQPHRDAVDARLARIDRARVVVVDPHQVAERDGGLPGGNQAEVHGGVARVAGRVAHDRFCPRQQGHRQAGDGGAGIRAVVVVVHVVVGVGRRLRTAAGARGEACRRRDAHAVVAGCQPREGVEAAAGGDRRLQHHRARAVQELDGDAVAR